MLVYDKTLAADYQHLWDTMTVNHDAPIGIIENTVNNILKNQKRYIDLGAKLIIPWAFIACVHQLEAGGSFMKHLHNGDWLVARTIHVPKGRPAKGNPPFSWEYSAIDALINCQGLGIIRDWSIPHILYLLEGYNGYGYRMYHPQVKSPYLWSMTNHYTKGKYVADGHYDPNTISKQVGAAIILKGILNGNH